MLERKAKKKSMNSYNKMADVDIKRGEFILCALVKKIVEKNGAVAFIYPQQCLSGGVVNRVRSQTTKLYSYNVEIGPESQKDEEGSEYNLPVLLFLVDVKDLASKLVNEIEESDKKIIYLKHVQRQLRVS